MKFTLNIEPPKATAQQKGAFVCGGKIRFFEKSKVKSAREILYSALLPYKPNQTIEKAVNLTVKFFFTYRKSEKKSITKNNLIVPHVVRPDLDNLEKLLLDVMTSMQFWKDDSQVCVKWTEKHFAPQGKIEIEIQEI
jgi:Holliday junction resolvase RusA-like endonuclease